MMIKKIIDLSKQGIKKYKKCDEKYYINNEVVYQCFMQGRYKIIYKNKKVEYLCIKHIGIVKQGIDRGYIEYDNG